MFFMFLIASLGKFPLKCRRFFPYHAGFYGKEISYVISLSPKIKLLTSNIDYSHEYKIIFLNNNAWTFKRCNYRKTVTKSARWAALWSICIKKEHSILNQSLKDCQNYREYFIHRSLVHKGKVDSNKSPTARHFVIDLNSFRYQFYFNSVHQVASSTRDGEVQFVRKLWKIYLLSSHFW